MIYRNQAEAGPGDRTSRTRKSLSPSYGHEICGGIIFDGFIGGMNNIGKGTIKKYPRTYECVVQRTWYIPVCTDCCTVV